MTSFSSTLAAALEQRFLLLPSVRGSLQTIVVHDWREEFLRIVSGSTSR